MAKIGRVVIVIYGLLMLFGGIGGYAKAKSVPSLVSGIVSAVLLGYAVTLLNRAPKAAFGLSLGVAVVLAGVFVERIVRTHKAMPSGGLCALSLIVAVIFWLAMTDSSGG